MIGDAVVVMIVVSVELKYVWVKILVTVGPGLERVLVIVVE
jgi:hypothetical protein